MNNGGAGGNVLTCFTPLISVRTPWGVQSASLKAGLAFGPLEGQGCRGPLAMLDPVDCETKTPKACCGKFSAKFDVKTHLWLFLVKKKAVSERFRRIPAKMSWAHPYFKSIGRKNLTSQTSS